MKTSWVLILAALLLQTSMVARGESTSVYLVPAVFWEGEPLEEENWKALAAFQKAFPNVPLAHFFTPVYFMRPTSKDGVNLAAKWKAVLRPEDTSGLQLSGWKSLVEGAGVTFLSEPTFWGAPLLHCDMDCGHEVPLSAYNDADWVKILKHGVGTLQNQGITPKVFLAGGHMSSEAMIQHLPEVGISADFSGIDPKVLTASFHPYPWFQMVTNRWSTVTLFSVPKKIPTPNGAVTQFYQSLGPIDDLSFETFQERYTQLALSTQPGPRILFWGFHFETIGKNLNKVLKAMTFVQQFHKEKDLPWKSLSTLLEDASAFPY